METNGRVIVAFSTKTNSLLYVKDGKEDWHPVVGKAVDYISKTVKGGTYDIGENDKGEVIYMKLKGPAPSQVPMAKSYDNPHAMVGGLMHDIVKIYEMWKQKDTITDLEEFHKFVKCELEILIEIQQNAVKKIGGN